MFELRKICWDLACQVGDRFKDPRLANLGSVVLVLMVVVGFLIWKRYHRRKWARIWHKHHEHELDWLEPNKVEQGDVEPGQLDPVQLNRRHRRPRHRARTESQIDPK